MNKIAIIEKYPSNLNYTQYFKFSYTLFSLCSKNKKKILKADIDIVIDTDDYDYIILVGAEPTKEFAKVNSVVTYQGQLIKNKFIPITSPSMLAYKPAGIPAFEKAVSDVNAHVNQETEEKIIAETILVNENSLLDLMVKLHKLKNAYIALDSETSALYPRKGFVLGISITFEDNIGYYIPSDILDDDVLDGLQHIWNNNIVIFHNAKFDMKFFRYHFNWIFNDIHKFEDTILLHYCLNENSGTHDLKQLAIKYTPYGDYERELEVFKADYCRLHKIKRAEFSYEFIPVEILAPYAATDTIVTFELFKLFYPRVQSSKGLTFVYENLLKKGTIALLEVEENGIPFSPRELKIAQEELNDRIFNLTTELYNFNSVKEFENQNQKEFNPNSVIHLREVLFNLEGLPVPSKRTDKGAISTDAEVLTELAKVSDLAGLILKIKQTKKIKSTFIDKVLIHLDSDQFLRTVFNLFATVSGRLSSSGTLNAQQFPRDDKTVKRCIVAPKGYKIVSHDLGTAEMYIVSVLSGDKVLQQVFIDGDDYHGYMAKHKFNLPCHQNEIKDLYPDYRQSAKSISFEILYKLNLREPMLDKFTVLKKWLESKSKEARIKGFLYEFFGRKRRLPNVFSKDRGQSQHEIRSGINSLVQGPASDINLFSCIDMIGYIKRTGMKSKIFMLVHDSIVALVPDDELEHYNKRLKAFTQKDRGLSIPGHPIKVDIEIGQDYTFKK